MDGFCTPNWDGSFRSRHQTKEFGLERADRLDLDGSFIYPHFHSNDSGGWLYFYGSDSKDSLFYDHVSEDWIKIQSNR